jgi:hypothetical protein
MARIQELEQCIARYERAIEDGELPDNEAMAEVLDRWRTELAHEREVAGKLREALAYLAQHPLAGKS